MGRSPEPALAPPPPPLGLSSPTDGSLPRVERLATHPAFRTCVASGRSRTLVLMCFLRCLPVPPVILNHTPTERTISLLDAEQWVSMLDLLWCRQLAVAARLGGARFKSVPALAGGLTNTRMGWTERLAPRATAGAVVAAHDKVDSKVDTSQRPGDWSGASRRPLQV